MSVIIQKENKGEGNMVTTTFTKHKQSQEYAQNDERDGNNNN